MEEQEKAAEQELPTAVAMADLYKAMFAAEQVKRLKAQLDSLQKDLRDAEAFERQVGATIQQTYKLGPKDSISQDNGLITRAKADG